MVPKTISNEVIFDDASTIEITSKIEKLSIDKDQTKDDTPVKDKSRVFSMLGILKNLIGVKDLVNLRLSLPTQLLDPVSNLEYWGYMDHPDTFLRIPDSDEPLERMVASVRWWLLKDSKHTRNKIVKPFNSILGEQFFCKWHVNKSEVDFYKTSSCSTIIPNDTDSNNGSINTDVYTVEYITEQVSHHPPVSAYVYRCKEKNIQVSGMDHISAQFSGLHATISPGSWSKGVFITLGDRDDETYVCTHSTAHVVGWLTANLKVIKMGTTRITCEKTKLATIIDFSEKNWYGKIKDVVDGKIIRYDPESDDISKWTAKTLPKRVHVLATVSGNSGGKLHVKYTHDGESELLADILNAKYYEKTVKPHHEQTELESRVVWGKVIEKMKTNDHSTATTLKIELEDKQRAKAAERKEKGEPFVSALFVHDFESGNPVLRHDAVINI